MGYLRLKFCNRVVVDNPDMRISNLAVENLRANEKVCETVLVCLLGARLSQNGVENLVTLSL